MPLNTISINPNSNNLSPFTQNIKNIQDYTTFSILKWFSQEEINFFIEKVRPIWWINDIIQKIWEQKAISLANELLLNKKFNNIFLYILDEWEILEKLSIDPKWIIDRIFDDYKEITNFTWNVSKYGWDTWIKNYLNYAISKLIFANPNYYFERLINLDQNSFRRAVQKTHQTSILWYLNNTEPTERNENLMKDFCKKLVKIVWIDNLKDNKARWFDNNYYYYINLYYPEAFNKINIENILEEKSYITCDKKYLIDKLLDTDNWFQKVLKMKIPAILKKVLEDDKVVKYVINNFSDKDILLYLNLINKIHYYYENDISDENYDLLIDKIFSKSEYKKEENNIEYIKNIITNPTNIKFINLFIDDFDSFDKLFDSEVLKEFLNKTDELKENIINFINVSRNIDNFKFELNLEDINEEFIKFIEENFWWEKIIYYKLEFEVLSKINDKKITSYQDLWKENKIIHYFGLI